MLYENYNNQVSRFSQFNIFSDNFLINAIKLSINNFRGIQLDNLENDFYFFFNAFFYFHENS